MLIFVAYNGKSLEVAVESTTRSVLTRIPSQRRNTYGDWGCMGAIAIRPKEHNFEQENHQSCSNSRKSCTLGS